MPSAKSADNPKTVRIINGLSDGTSIPNNAISAIPTIAEALEDYSTVQVAISAMPPIF